MVSTAPSRVLLCTYGIFISSTIKNSVERVHAHQLSTDDRLDSLFRANGEHPENAQKADGGQGTGDRAEKRFRLLFE